MASFRSAIIRRYVYDVETGLYYLNNRYYIPEWERFLNEDCVIQENLYAYCKDNPIILGDADGTLPGLLWPGEIHREIQKRIMQQNKGIIAMEVSIRIEKDELGRFELGRIDLLNKDTGEYWELKTVVPTLDSILFQMTRYLKPKEFVKDLYAHLLNKNGQLKKGGLLKGDSFLYTSRLGQEFKVWYEQTYPGIIRYVYQRIDEKPIHLKLPSTSTSSGMAKGIGMIGLFGVGVSVGLGSAALGYGGVADPMTLEKR